LRYLDDQCDACIWSTVERRCRVRRKNVYTVEVENLLYSQCPVAEAAIFGVPDVHWGRASTRCWFLGPNRELNNDQQRCGPPRTQAYTW